MIYHTNIHACELLPKLHFIKVEDLCLKDNLVTIELRVVGEFGINPISLVSSSAYTTRIH